MALTPIACTTNINGSLPAIDNVIFTSIFFIITSVKRLFRVVKDSFIEAGWVDAIRFLSSVIRSNLSTGIREIRITSCNVISALFGKSGVLCKARDCL